MQVVHTPTDLSPGYTGRLQTLPASRKVYGQEISGQGCRVLCIWRQPGADAGSRHPFRLSKPPAATIVAGYNKPANVARLRTLYRQREFSGVNEE